MDCFHSSSGPCHGTPLVPWSVHSTPCCHVQCQCDNADVLSPNTHMFSANADICLVLMLKWLVLTLTRSVLMLMCPVLMLMCPVLMLTQLVLLLTFSATANMDVHMLTYYTGHISLLTVHVTSLYMCRCSKIHCY